MVWQQQGYKFDHWKYVMSWYWFILVLPHLDASTIKNGKILGHIAVPVYKCNLTNVDFDCR